MSKASKQIHLIGISGKIGSGKDTVGTAIQYFMHTKATYQKEYFDDFNKTYSSFDKFNLSGWKIKKYADKLKDIVCLLIGCTREQLEDQEFKNTPLGKEWLRCVCVNSTGCNEIFYNQKDAEAYQKYWQEPTRSINIIPTSLTPRLLLQLLGTDCGRKIIHENIWINALFADYRTQVDFNNNLPRNCDWIITDVRFPNEADAIKEREGLVIRLTRSISVDKEIANHPSETALDYYDKFDYILDNQGTEEELYAKVYNMLTELKML